MANIRRRLRGLGEFRVYTVQSTIYVEPESDACDMDEAFEIIRCLERVCKRYIEQLTLKATGAKEYSDKLLFDYFIAKCGK